MIESIDQDKCTHCGLCVQICPMDVLHNLGNFVYIAHQQDCMTCFLCEEACSSNAIYVDPHRGHEVVFPF